MERDAEPEIVDPLSADDFELHMERENRLAHARWRDTSIERRREIIAALGIDAADIISPDIPPE